MTAYKFMNGLPNWIPGDFAYSAEINLNIPMAYAPIGAVVPWMKTITGTPSLPAGWHECNGATISDADSPYNGTAVPDINGQNYFLRGNTTSGGTGGANTANLAHTHIETAQQDVLNHPSTGGVIKDNFINSNNTTTSSSLSSTQDMRPAYMSAVYIVRIK